MSSVRQYDPHAAQLGYLSESIHRQLTERECGVFDRGLADYHRRKNVKAFVECLSLVLNTNHKRQLLIPIRDTYVKPSDTGRFNQLVQARGLATSLKKKRREQAESEKSGGGDDGGGKSADGIHKVDVKRDPGGEWGFNIRGGSDQGTGVFVSWVEPESNSHKSGLMVGDQILKANDTSFESIKHHDAVQLIRGCKKLRLWVLSHGRVPTTRMAHKVYRWVDPDGRSTSPPPDPFVIAEKRARGEYQFGSDADERKVTVMVDSGKELGISIRGGSEHGLGVYVSKVDEASVAESYGIKIGDQILEVNGVSFLSIVHADAARALRAQPCMVIKVKDVGKLPHSRITTYGQTQWHKGKQRDKEKVSRGKKAFQKGAGTQVMLKKYETAGTKSHGLMNEVARSVLTTHELSTFSYYIKQYEQRSISVDDLATALLELLDTPEKLQLVGEVRGVIRAVDLDRYNELTIHHEIAAKKARRSRGGGGLGSVGGSQSRLVSRDGSTVMASSSQPPATHHTIAEVHEEGPQALQSRLSPPAAADMSFSSGGGTLPFDDEDVDFGGRDQVPQRMSPVNRKPQGTGPPVFHAPPPPLSSFIKPSTSTPDTGGQSQMALTDGLKERRQRMRQGDQSTMDEEDAHWESQFSAAPSLSTIRSPHIEGAVSVVSLPEIEARIQQELEEKMKREFEEKERQLEVEHIQRLEREKQEKEEQLRKEREVLEQQLAEAEEKTAREVEERVRREAEEEMRLQMQEREIVISQKMERLVAEQQAERESHRDEEKERLKMELEEKIWKEAEEGMRHEFENRMQREFESRTQQERQNLQQQTKELKAEALEEAEQRLRQQLEEKYQEEYEVRLEEERTKMKEKDQEEQRRMEALERQRQQEEVEKMEAEEQAKIDLEEKIRQEMEAAVRAEYEARLQFETEQRARLAEEVKAHKAMEQRLEQEREELEREKERAQREREETETGEMEERRGQEQREKRKKREAAERREAEERERAVARKKEREERQRKEQEAADRKRREEERKRAKNERQRLAQERQKREREEEEQFRIMIQQQEVGNGGGNTEEDDEADKMLRIQRELAAQQEREEEEETRRQEEIERREREAAAALKQSEAERKKDIQRKREENIRRREEEQKRREEEQRLRLEGQKKKREEEERNRRQEEVDRATNGKKATRAQQIAVKFGDETEEAVQKRQKSRDKERLNQQRVEEERCRAEEKLQRRVEKMKHQQQQQPDNASEEAVATSAEGGREGGKSYGGYTDLHGEIVTVTVRKVCKKLGIAIDGGANTKQKAVIIREISPEGCAAKTASPTLRMGQQILQVDNTSLYSLKHKETVMAIKGAFEGPMNKTLTFVILDNPEENEETDGPLVTPGPLPPQEEEPPTPEPTPQHQPLVPEIQPAPEFHRSQPRVQLRKKKRPPEVERRMREKGLDEFIAEASTDLPSHHHHQPPKPSPQQQKQQQPAMPGLSFGGYSNLRGEILTIPVTKVNKKLGMAIDGGANTKQVAITIRQITPDGSAALSGKGLKTGQQILQVNSKTLHGLSHSDVVSVIKSAFEGQINKTTVTFIVLDPPE